MQILLFLTFYFSINIFGHHFPEKKIKESLEEKFLAYILETFCSYVVTIIFLKSVFAGVRGF